MDLTAPGENPSLGSLQRQIRALRAEMRRMVTSPGLINRSTFGAAVIPSSALLSPAAPGSVSLSATVFALSTAGGVVVSGTVTVPARMTSCVLTLVGRVYAANSTGVDDYLLCRAEVVTGGGTISATAVPVRVAAAGAAGDAALNVSPLGLVLTGLTPGSTFTVRVWAQSANAAWTADPDNIADLAGSLGWFA